MSYKVDFDEFRRVVIHHGDYKTHLEDHPIVYYSGKLANGSFAVWAGDRESPLSIYIFHHTRELPVSSTMAISRKKKHSFRIKGNDIHVTIGNMNFRF